MTHKARSSGKGARERSLGSAAASITRIRHYYNATIAHEAQRLEENAYRRLEHDMTMRTIVRHVPGGARILDVGGGPGAYLEPLVRRGFDPWLCDLSDANVAVARERATALGLADVVRRVRQSDATNLKHYARACRHVADDRAQGHVVLEAAIGVLLEALSFVGDRRIVVLTNAGDRFSCGTEASLLLFFGSRARGVSHAIT